MAENTKIEWAHHTFNPWIGCTKVGPGCDHCYAEADFDKRRHVVKWGAGQARKRTAPSTWALPVRWNAEAVRLGVRYRVFCASLADVFDNEVDREWRDDLATLILNTPHLDWLLVTKRIGNAGRMLGEMFMDGTPDNVWLGATITSQDEADRDIPKLVEVPARVRFLSMEPLLGPVDIRKWLDPYTCADCGFHGCDDDSGPCGCSRCGESDAFSDGRDECKSCGADDQSANRSCPSCGSHRSYERDMGFIWSSEQRLIDWVIVGGESGPNARPMHPNWARSLRDQCDTADVPFLFKQWGEWKPIGQMEEAEHGGLYKSCVAAKPHESQSNLDDIYGRRCTVPTTVLHADGSTHDITEPMAFLQGTEAMQIFRVGKKAADRLLDGVQHDGYPEVRHA